jgi:hypothetical protein
MPMMATTIISSMSVKPFWIVLFMKTPEKENVRKICSAHWAPETPVA